VQVTCQFHSPAKLGCNLPRLGQRLAGTDDETRSNGASDGNHGNVSRFQATVQMGVVGVNDSAVAVSGGHLATGMLVL